MNSSAKNVSIGNCGICNLLLDQVYKETYVNKTEAIVLTLTSVIILIFKIVYIQISKNVMDI